MHGDAGKVAFAQQLVEFGGTQRALDEYDDLVEFQGIEELIQLPVLLRLTELDVELLQAVQGQLRFIVDVDFERVLHELLADRSDLLSESGAEHHDLLLSRSGSEDVLDVPAHVYCRSSVRG